MESTPYLVCVVVVMGRVCECEWQEMSRGNRDVILFGVCRFYIHLFNLDTYSLGVCV